MDNLIMLYEPFGQACLTNFPEFRMWKETFLNLEMALGYSSEPLECLKDLFSLYETENLN